jgi:hypothetical protein
VSNLSVEKLGKRALRRMLFWRMVGELFTIPQILFYTISQIFTMLGNIVMVIAGFFNGLRNWFRAMEMAVFYLELDAARKYKLITGMDLAAASGDPTRYGRLDPAVTDSMTEQFQKFVLDEEGE